MKVIQTMTATAFRQWQSAMEMSDRKAAGALGLHYNTIAKYRREGAPRQTALACAALYHRIEPWR